MSSLNPNPDRKIRGSLSVEECCQRAVETPCARETEDIIRGVTVSGRLPTEDLAGVLQRILEVKTSITNVALSCLYHLGVLGEEYSRPAIETILSQGASNDTDVIYAGAMGALLRASNLSKRDLQVIAEGYVGPYGEVRSSIERTTVGLDPERLNVMLTLNASNVRAGVRGSAQLQSLFERAISLAEQTA